MGFGGELSKGEKNRLARDARWAGNNMDNDDAAQEVMEDEAAEAKGRWEAVRDGERSL
jgi:hypothetical protein